MNETNENALVDNQNISNSKALITDNQISTLAASPVYDYYDYYNRVLQKLDNIENYENTIVQNQDTFIACCQRYNSQFTLISFLIALVFCYMVIKSYLKV